MLLPVFKIFDRLAVCATGSLIVNWSVYAKQESEGTASATKLKTLTKLVSL